MLFIIVVILLFIFLFIDIIYPIEKFEPSNSFFDSIDEQREIYIEENKKFDIINIEKNIDTLIFETYIPNGQLLDNEYFKKIVIDYINEFKKNSINLSLYNYNTIRDLYNISIAVENDTTYYQFNIDIINTSKNILHTLKVIINENKLYSIKNIYDNISKKFEPNSFSNLYRIKNTLYLTDPFLTSGFSMLRE